MSSILSIVYPHGPYQSTCGYCSPQGERSEEETSYHTAALTPIQLSCDVYQKMIDRGWRRSGEYCYKPDLKRSCCPQYTIRLDALEFKPSKSQRKLLNRWNKHIIYGEDDNGTDAVGTSVGNSSTKTPNKPPNKSPPASFVSLVHASETSFITDGIDPAHKFEVTIEPSSFTEEKFALFQSYEKHIHKKDETKPSGFRRFLVDTPLVREEIPYSSPPPSHLPTHYGAHHQLYRLDGELIAMGVIDILPNCVSSVYFMWEKRFEKFSLGKISALREASLAREIREAGAKHMGYLYMGFYIQSCQKMRYKGEYAPSYLADPEEYTWHPIETCKPLLEKTRYVSFAHPEHSTNEPADPSAGKRLSRVFFVMQLLMHTV
ncbi:uncharacterized protein STEHIDRAFT_95770 [Stereum hirsutum FP-91666 SS1]|uniref:uncharacterized protein n=1 Tax=Stereum hirsutum (strain FP-91666) TaxID=721885 RepID=UPI000440F1A5|nr:uncharacterized protein STEHIDRAFT_95770 [Stereum hirsutum FP-91666 SS1]EIM88514.1 hypothetical protein STEHIDRAFT_95770 [Stereum hirsutum FP-91666 SS1]